MIKISRLALVCAIVTSPFLAPAAARADTHFFTLYNDTVTPIENIYVRMTGDDNDSDWSDDLLGDNDVLDANYNQQFTITNADSCNWDIKIVFQNINTSEIASDVDLCTDSDVKVWYDYGNNSFNYNSW